MEAEADASVQDIVDFQLKINNSERAIRELSRFSSVDRLQAFTLIASSGAHREYKIEVARAFLHDLDTRVRRKAELLMESLLPDWVADPAERILELLKQVDTKGTSHRNAAVKFLFGVIDSRSLRSTLLTLLDASNRDYLPEILAIIEEYICTSEDEREQVKIFDACLDLMLSESSDNQVKHHAATLLSVFFKKVQVTELGEALRRKFVEKQIEKAERVYSFLCNANSALSPAYLEDLIRPLADADELFQSKILGYFQFVLEKIRCNEDIDTVVDTYPNYENQHELNKDEKIKLIRNRILAAVDDLWSRTDTDRIRGLVGRIRYGEYPDKRQLLQQITTRMEQGTCDGEDRERIASLLRCFLLSGEAGAHKLQAAHLLLNYGFSTLARRDALAYLATYVEVSDLNYAERESLVKSMESLLNDPFLPETIRERAGYVLCIAAPGRLSVEDVKPVLRLIRNMVEEESVTSHVVGQSRLLDALSWIEAQGLTYGKSAQAAAYLKHKLTLRS